MVVTSDLDVCVLFKGWFDCSSLAEEYATAQSHVQYEIGEIHVPGHAADSMAREVVLYACGVAIGLFDDLRCVPDA